MTTTHGKFKAPRHYRLNSEESITQTLGTAGITEEQTKALHWFFSNELRLLQREKEKEYAKVFEVLKAFATGMLVTGFATLVYHFFWVW